MWMLTARSGSYRTMGLWENSRAWELGFALTPCGVCILGEKRDWRRSGNAEGLEKSWAHMCCLWISSPACALRVLPEVERPGVLCKGEPAGTLTPALSYHLPCCLIIILIKQWGEISKARTLSQRDKFYLESTSLGIILYFLPPTSLVTTWEEK
jgi:hypothetical protein